MEKYTDKLLDNGLSGLLILMAGYFVLRLMKFSGPIIRDGVGSLVAKVREFMDSLIELHASMQANDTKQTELLGELKTLTKQLHEKVDTGFQQLTQHFTKTCQNTHGGTSQ